uniref:hypothetical protein n=1 Tax=Microbacterium sp. K36 TaxID=2305439 RepID=UPI00197B43ED
TYGSTRNRPDPSHHSDQYPAASNEWAAKWDRSPNSWRGRLRRWRDGTPILAAYDGVIKSRTNP